MSDAATNLTGWAIGASGAVFGFLAWRASRERQPFRLGEKHDDIVQLTRTKRPTVQILEVFVFGNRALITKDRAATVEFRILERDESLILSVEAIRPGESVTVRYRNVWPWDRFAKRPSVPSSLPGWVHRRIARSPAKVTQQRESLRENHKVWKYWHDYLL